MSIYKSAINRPITTFMIFTAVIVVGIYALIKMPVDLYPEIDPPYISVMTTYPGASALDIETNITKILEDALNTVDNVKEVTSTSTDNLSAGVCLYIDYSFWRTDHRNRTYPINTV
jgi:HAE1 family hydrophobic/amphiphilic exporter-1